MSSLSLGQVVTVDCLQDGLRMHVASDLPRTTQHLDYRYE
jgi:hypothetical protein